MPPLPWGRGSEFLTTKGNMPSNVQRSALSFIFETKHYPEHEWCMASNLCRVFIAWSNILCCSASGHPEERRGTSSTKLPTFLCRLAWLKFRHNGNWKLTKLPPSINTQCAGWSSIPGDYTSGCWCVGLVASVGTLGSEKLHRDLPAKGRTGSLSALLPGSLRNRLSPLLQAFQFLLSETMCNFSYIGEGQFPRLGLHSLPQTFGWSDRHDP